MKLEIVALRVEMNTRTSDPMLPARPLDGHAHWGFLGGSNRASRLGAFLGADRPVSGCPQLPPAGRNGAEKPINTGDTGCATQLEPG